jgi:hypothetical protein
MPKTTASDRAKIFERLYPTEFIVDSANQLFCLLCSKNVSSEKNFRVESHRNSAKHKKLLQTTLSTSASTSSATNSQVNKDFAERVT